MNKYSPKFLTNKAHRANKIDILIKVANLADTPKEFLFSEEPSIMEELGLTLRIIRKKKNLDHQSLAIKSNCSPEIILALEMGVLPIKEISLHLPKILRELGIKQNIDEKSIKNLSEENDAL